MVEEQKLYHVWCEPIGEFFKRIDEYGGWPLNTKYVSFYHSVSCSTGRVCEFGNEELRTLGGLL